MEIVIEQIKKNAEPVLKKNDIAYAGLFGSYLHGTAGPESDIDLVVRFSKPKSLFDIVALERDLSASLGKKTDVVTEGSLSKYFRDEVLRDALPIYEQKYGLQINALAQKFELQS